MTFLAGLHGTIALVLFCALLFAEESGVPLPFAPGEAVLIAAGILVANGGLSAWFFVPAACAAVVGGAVAGYLWTRALGSRGLQALAERLHAARALDRARERLMAAGPTTIAISRLIPGLRIYTSLVAGAIGVKLRTFVLGTVPAAILWVSVFTLLGALVGIPAEHFLSRAGRLAVDAVIYVAIGVAALVALQRVPPVERHHNALLRAPGPWRLLFALAIDIGIVASIVSGITEFVRDGGGPVDPDGITDVALIIGAIAVSYIVVSRRGAGATGGEALLHVTYRSGWPGRR